MFIKSIVTVGGRHFDPLFDIPIELPSKSGLTENYLYQLQNLPGEANRDIVEFEKNILDNENLLERVETTSVTEQSEPVIKCLKRCKSSRKKCCKIFHKRREQVGSDLQDRETIPSFQLSESVGIIGTFLGVALAGYRLTQGMAKTARDNGLVLSNDDKIFISGGDDNLDWIDKLKDFIRSEGSVDGETSFLCCIHVGERPGLECYPQPPRPSRSTERRKLVIGSCESGLSYNIDVVM